MDEEQFRLKCDEARRRQAIREQGHVVGKAIDAMAKAYLRFYQGESPLPFGQLSVPIEDKAKAEWVVTERLCLEPGSRLVLEIEQPPDEDFDYRQDPWFDDQQDQWDAWAH